MRTIVAAILFGLVACGGGPSTARHIDALTGEECQLDPGSYVPRDPDVYYPDVDCTHHDDVENHDGACCEFPQPGCDKNGCCDDEVVVPDPDPGSGSGSDDGPVVI